MKPFGMEFGVRISYLRKNEKPGQSTPHLDSTGPGMHGREEDHPYRTAHTGIPFTSLPGEEDIRQMLPCSLLRLSDTDSLQAFQKVNRNSH